VVRPARVDDHAAIVELAGAALGWRPDEPNADLFRWKHVDGAFGPSHLWVAEADGRLAAFRAMLRWRFRWAGDEVEAVRAVDTATHPDHQGRGLFRRLTLHAVEQLTAEGTAFVFNTPNANSRPGYLTMGWRTVGRVPVGVQVASVGSLVRLTKARVPADKWSLDTSAGEPATSVLADGDGVAALLDSLPAEPGLCTARSVEQLRWRYGAGPVRYRIVLAGSRVEQGLAVFRVRQRGAAVETTVADVLVPGGDPRVRRALVAGALRSTGGDYAIATQRAALDGRQVRLPGQGPILTWRALARTDEPPADAWRLSLGDVELF